MITAALQASLPFAPPWTLTLEDGLLALSWLLLIFIWAFTRRRLKLRFFRVPILLLLLSATAARAIAILRIEEWTIVASLLFALAIAYFVARIIVFITFDLIIDRRKDVPTPALIKTLIFFGLLTLIIVIINETIAPYHVSLTSLLASAAVISVVLGLALQETLSHLFSGLALQLESPLKVGHWIKIGDSVGKVAEMNWRSVKLRTTSNDYHVLPNSMVSSQRIINFSDPPSPHRREILIRAPYSASPDHVISSVLPSLLRIAGIESQPKPQMIVRDFGEHWMDYQVRYWYKDFEHIEIIEGEIRRQVWYHFRRDQIASPEPVRHVLMREVKDEALTRSEQLEEMRRHLQSVSIFEPLSQSEFDRVLGGMHFNLYAAGERIITQAESGDSFFVLYSGEAEVSALQNEHERTVIKLLRKGDYFGEISLLTGERRTATVTAITECGCYVVGKELFKTVLEANPKIAEDLSVRLATRRAELTERLDAFEEEERKRRKGEGPLDLPRRILARIKSYFGLK